VAVFAVSAADSKPVRVVWPPPEIVPLVDWFSAGVPAGPVCRSPPVCACAAAIEPTEIASAKNIVLGDITKFPLKNGMLDG
jgi:hypothetical protein